jgi:WD40 repeat protein
MCFKRWDTRTGGGLATYTDGTLPDQVEVRAALSSDEQWFASGTKEGELRVWSLATLGSDELTPSCASIPLSQRAVGSACFNGDDTQIACGGLVDGWLYVVEFA